MPRATSACEPSLRNGTFSLPPRSPLLRWSPPSGVSTRVALTAHATARPALTHSITCSSLAFSWPDGTPVFEGLDVAFGPGRTGLVGVNGSGKSTLLKLIAGELTPLDGAVRLTGEVGHLPQNVALDTALKVDEALGIAAQRAALHAIEAGDVSEAHFEIVGDDWDVEERALATLGELGLGHVDL